MSLDMSLTVPTKTQMKPISVRSCSKPPRCRHETGHWLVCGAWGISHEIVPHPAWFADPADTCFCSRARRRTWDVSYVANAPTAVCTAHLHKGNAVIYLVNAYVSALGVVHRGPRRQRTASPAGRARLLFRNYATEAREGWRTFCT